MSFSRLPPAVLLLVAFYLQDEEQFIAPYATISRPWKSVIEAFTFRQIRVDSVDRLHQVVQYLSHDRWAALRCVDVFIQLPEYGEDQWFEPESEYERETNNSAFTKSLKTVFETVDSWREHATVPAQDRGLTLAIRTMCKSDLDNMEDFDQKMERHRLTSSGANHARYEASYLHLLEELPALAGVSQLILRGALRTETIYGQKIWNCCPRLMSGETASRIIKACPHVKIVEAELFDKESKNLTLRNEERKAFAQSLAELPESLVQLKLDYPGVVPQNHSFDPPTIPATHGKDALSLDLGRLSQRLESLELLGVLSEDFFHMSDPSTTWPRLRDLRIKFNYCTPNGDWMLEQDPEDTDMEADDDEDEQEQYRDLKDWMRDFEIPARMHFPDRPFRTAVRSDILDDMHLAAAKVVARMPRIRNLELCIGHHKCTY